MRYAALLFLVACGGGAVTGASDAGPTHDASAPDAAADDASDPGSDAAPTAMIHVSGVVVDAQNAPWAAAKIQVCSASVCTLGNADASGAFDVSVLANDHYHVIAHPSPTDSRDGSAGIGVFPSILSSDAALAAPVVLPVTGARTNVSGAFDAHVTTDLELAGTAADLDYASAAYVAAVRVDSAAWPAFSIPNQTILAIWALNPWGTRTLPSKTIAVTIQNGFGLSAGDTASVYALSETTADLGTPTTATVSPDSTTLTGATIDRLTWMVLAR